MSGGQKKNKDRKQKKERAQGSTADPGYVCHRIGCNKNLDRNATTTKRIGMQQQQIEEECNNNS
jgi:hypothetical protein